MNPELKFYLNSFYGVTGVLSNNSSDFEEEEVVKKEKKFYKGQPVISKVYGRTTYIYHDGSDCDPHRILDESRNDLYWVDDDDLTLSNKFTFSQVIAGLEAGYFEEGVVFENTKGRLFKVGHTAFSGFGLYAIDSISQTEATIIATIGSSDINTTWTLVEPEPKELTLDEIEELLGYKVKIKNNE